MVDVVEGAQSSGLLERLARQKEYDRVAAADAANGVALLSDQAVRAQIFEGRAESEGKGKPFVREIPASEILRPLMLRFAEAYAPWQGTIDTLAGVLGELAPEHRDSWWLSNRATLNGQIGKVASPLIHDGLAIWYGEESKNWRVVKCLSPGEFFAQDVWAPECNVNGRRIVEWRQRYAAIVAERRGDLTTARDVVAQEFAKAGDNEHYGCGWCRLSAPEGEMESFAFRGMGLARVHPQCKPTLESYLDTRRESFLAAVADHVDSNGASENKPAKARR